MKVMLPIQCSGCKRQFSPADLTVVDSKNYMCDDCYDEWADADFPLAEEDRRDE